MNNRMKGRQENPDSDSDTSPHIARIESRPRPPLQIPPEAMLPGMPPLPDMSNMSAGEIQKLTFKALQARIAPDRTLGAEEKARLAALSQESKKAGQAYGAAVKKEDYQEAMVLAKQSASASREKQ
uniref:Uncharacterized protein n=1 Tax=Chromera velia CCMP2878 TaxID=1169474 RepID=A0A0G4ICN6_9ALVE|eukprot:Cvel_2278.t1-p1 / transcript=Cvel_2278.t1 / gene=Cvel_2278 / organism=Chromera_velia_CCMP2878 / gene_product=hypothetical protein / transcript_product=hypothetical protein / location=Cvel_scaffold88:65256-66056(-) / protein_length=125 / sequence_SO=supercontig / SO=protein_coding / is_pseudo=false